MQLSVCYLSVQILKGLVYFRKKQYLCGNFRKQLAYEKKSMAIIGIVDVRDLCAHMGADHQLDQGVSDDAEREGIGCVSQPVWQMGSERS